MSQQEGLKGWAKRNKPLIAGACVAAAASYIAYRAYHSKGLASTQATLLRAAQTLQHLGAAAGAAGATLAQVANDLRTFLDSDSDEVPRSLRQLAKLAQCPEVQDTITSCVGAALRGAAGPATDAVPVIINRLLEAALSERGSSLVALAVSVAAREGTSSLVTSLHEAVLSSLGAPAPRRPTSSLQQQRQGAPWQTQQQQQQQQQQQRQQRASSSDASNPAVSTLADAAGAFLIGALALLQSPPGERLMQAIISSGVGSAVGACFDSAASCDVYGPMLDAFSRPEHRQALTELAAAMSGACCREMWAAIGTLPPVQVPAWQLPQGQLPGQQQHQQQQVDEELTVVQAVVSATSASATAVTEQQPPQQQVGEQTTLHLSHSTASTASLTGDGSSSPSTPQSGPTTPEPSLLGTTLSLRQPFSAGATGRRAAAGRLASSSSAAAASAAQRQVAAAAPIAPRAAGAGQLLVPSGQDAVLAGPVSWVVLMFAQASQHPEVRSLILDMSRSSTREFVRTLLPSFWTGERAASSGGSSGVGSWLQQQVGLREAGVAAPVDAFLWAHLRQVQVMLTVLLMVALYAVSPHMVLPSISGP